MQEKEIAEALSPADPLAALLRGTSPAAIAEKRLWLSVGVALAAGVALCAFSYYVLELSSGADQASVPLGPLALAVFAFGAVVMGVGAWARTDEHMRVAALIQTQMHRLENKLSYREDLLKLVSDHQPGAIMIFDRQNRYWFVNERAAVAIGRPTEEIIGQPPSKILSPELAKRLDMRLAEVRASGQALEHIDRVQTPDGKTRFIQEHYELLGLFAEQEGCVLVSEDDLTSLIVERERRENMLRQVINTLVAVVDRRDPYASGHSARVGQLARAVAEEMSLPTNDIDATEIAGSLMNFGKVLVPRHILTKVTPLSPEELQRIRDSILTSADILSIIDFDGPVVPTLRQVLEHFDGTGVPEGLKGDQILTTAQIVAVANAFVALVSPRAHRDGMALADALARLRDENDRSYDHRVLTALANYLENRPEKLDWIRALK